MTEIKIGTLNKIPEDETGNWTNLEPFTQLKFFSILDSQKVGVRENHYTTVH